LVDPEAASSTIVLKESPLVLNQFLPFGIADRRRRVRITPLEMFHARKRRDKEVLVNSEPTLQLLITCRFPLLARLLFTANNFHRNQCKLFAKKFHAIPNTSSV